MAPDVAKLHENAILIAQRIQTVLKRQRNGQPTVDPLVSPQFDLQQKLAKGLGLKWEGANLVPLKDAKVGG
jgi:hypothetical protein